MIKNKSLDFLKEQCSALSSSSPSRTDDKKGKLDELTASISRKISSNNQQQQQSSLNSTLQSQLEDLMNDTSFSSLIQFNADEEKTTLEQEHEQEQEASRHCLSKKRSSRKSSFRKQPSLSSTRNSTNVLLNTTSGSFRLTSPKQERRAKNKKEILALKMKLASELSEEVVESKRQEFAKSRNQTEKLRTNLEFLTQDKQDKENFLEKAKSFALSSPERLFASPSSSTASGACSVVADNNNNKYNDQMLLSPPAALRTKRVDVSTSPMSVVPGKENNNDDDDVDFTAIAAARVSKRDQKSACLVAVDKMERQQQRNDVKRRTADSRRGLSQVVNLMSIVDDSSNGKSKIRFPFE